MATQTYQLVISGNLAGQFVANVFHFRIDDAAAPTRLQAAKALIQGFIDDDKHTNFLTCLPSVYTLSSIKARCITSGGGAEYIDLQRSGDTGARSGSIMASSNGPVVLWFTDGPNRRIGKTFLPGVRAIDATDGSLLAAFITVINTAMASFRASFDTVGSLTTTAVFVISKSGDPTTRSLVISNNVSKNLGDQRRRQLPV